MNKWTLHRQPKDQITDHKFSIWCDNDLIILANEMPGEGGALAFIVDVMNIHEKKVRSAVEASTVENNRAGPRHPMSEDDQYTPLGRLLEILLSAVFVAALVSISYGVRAFGADLPPPDCWPWWQCNGTKETNHPNCKCWDSK